VREAEGELGRVRSRGGKAQGRIGQGWMCVSRGGARQLCMAATPKERGGHCGILLNTWHAAKQREWDGSLGHLRAKFGHGPNTKFEGHSKLYDFPLGSKVIRAVD
jgi:hypothetical protein